MPGVAITFSILFPKEVPARVRAALRSRLEDVGEALESLAVDGIFWDSIGQSEMRLDLGEWRFIYSVAEHMQLSVTKAHHLAG